MSNSDDPANLGAAERNYRDAAPEWRRKAAGWLRENWGPIAIAVVIGALLIVDSVVGEINLGCGIHIDGRPTEQAP